MENNISLNDTDMAVESEISPSAGSSMGPPAQKDIPKVKQSVRLAVKRSNLNKIIAHQAPSSRVMRKTVRTEQNEKAIKNRYIFLNQVCKR